MYEADSPAVIHMLTLVRLLGVKILLQSHSLGLE